MFQQYLESLIVVLIILLCLFDFFTHQFFSLLLLYIFHYLLSNFVMHFIYSPFFIKFLIHSRLFNNESIQCHEIIIDPDENKERIIKEKRFRMISLPFRFVLIQIVSLCLSRHDYLSKKNQSRSDREINKFNHKSCLCCVVR